MSCVVIALSCLAIFLVLYRLVVLCLVVPVFARYCLVIVLSWFVLHCLALSCLGFVCLVVYCTVIALSVLSGFVLHLSCLGLRSFNLRC